MRSLRNVFSNTSSSTSSPSDSPLSSRRSPGSKRRLTRQRKLRHVSEVDLGLQPIKEGSKSLPVSPKAGSRSPLNLRHWSMSAVPQPLPLPELPYIAKLNDTFPGHGRGEAGDGKSSSSAAGSSHGANKKTTDHIATKSSKFPTYHRRGFPQDSNDGTAHNFRLNVPARSAPTSGFSSPVVSPQRFLSVDYLHPSYAVSHEFRTSSAVQGSVFDRLAGSASQVLPERITPSPEHSPLHSPTLQSPRHGTGSPLVVACHSHSKFTLAAWPDSNSANVHPLPLPPGVAVPSHDSHPTTVSNIKDVSSMKGQWQKGKPIGRGTYGSVYVAINRINGAMCAMKEVDLVPDDSKSAECIKQLEQEIKVLQQLEHPNIVQYFGSEVVADRFCIYLEYVHPGSINNYVREYCGAMTECVVRNFTRHILSGLAYLHSTKTIHRDIKGANLLVNASGIVKLADFGLAKHLTGCAADFSLKGSPHWMAPEVLQAMMRKDANPELAYAVDIWSVGCTVIEMFTGKPPWSEYNGVQAMFNVLNKSPAVPETLSAEGKDFLHWCFQRNPEDRPSAVKLLDHPFTRNTHDQNVWDFTQKFSGMKLNDWNKLKDLKPVLPGQRINQGKVLLNGDTCSQSYPETLDSGPVPRHSPRSTLEVLSSTSFPELNHNLYDFNLKFFSQNSHPEAGKHHRHVYFTTH